MKHKVSELEGALLDAAVARAMGMVRHRLALPPDLPPGERALLDWYVDPAGNYLRAPGPSREAEDNIEINEFDPSTTWAVGGPIIERERIAVWAVGSGWNALVGSGPASKAPSYQGSGGPTALVAAMRAFVASKFGEEVELP